MLYRTEQKWDSLDERRNLGSRRKKEYKKTLNCVKELKIRILYGRLFKEGKGVGWIVCTKHG